MRLISRITFFGIIYLIIKFIETSQIKLLPTTKINIYCSNEFFFANRLNRLCRWLYDNGTAYADTYQSALNDCPSGYKLGVFGNLNGTQLKFSCAYLQKIWINKNSSNNCNIITTNFQGSVFTMSEIDSNKNEYFLCLNKTQQIACGADEYLDKFSLLCLNTHYYNQTCSYEEMCSKAFNLTCNLPIGLCECQSTHFWNGTRCIKKKFLSESCIDTSIKCADFQGLICINGKCSCNESMYYDTTASLCVKKKLMNESCTQSYECDDFKRLFCSQVSFRCIKCPANWTMDSNYCYYYNDKDLATWPVANQSCVSFGGNLLNIRSLADYSYFENVFFGKEFWIGLYKIRTGWFWPDGMIFDDKYSWWQNGEPGIGDDCARISSGFLFYGRPCSFYSYEFACQIL